MLIRSSHLAIRFYVNDGWTKEEAEKYITPIEDDAVERHGYFRSAQKCKINIDKIIEDGHTVSNYNNAIITFPNEIRKYLELF